MKPININTLTEAIKALPKPNHTNQILSVHVSDRLSIIRSINKVDTETVEITEVVKFIAVKYALSENNWWLEWELFDNEETPYK